MPSVMTRAMEELPKMFRDVVTAVDLDELSYKETARRLGVPVGTVIAVIQ